MDPIAKPFTFLSSFLPQALSVPMVIPYVIYLTLGGNRKALGGGGWQCLPLIENHIKVVYAPPLTWCYLQGPPPLLSHYNPRAYLNIGRVSCCRICIYGIQKVSIFNLHIKLFSGVPLTFFSHFPFTRRTATQERSGLFPQIFLRSCKSLH